MYDLPDNLVSGEVYEGILWAAQIEEAQPKARKGKGAKSAKGRKEAEEEPPPPPGLGKRRPIAVVAIKIL